MLEAVATHIREQAAAYCEATKVPGYLAGVYHDGDQTVVAHGVANAVTGAPMRDDTGFLFGSVTKVLTTTLVLQQVERGLVDLDERVITYLPEFKLATPAAAEEIRVRNLLNHTNGIDADLFFPDAKGRVGHDPNRIEAEAMQSNGYTPVDVTRPTVARRHFFQWIGWFPDSAAAVSSWALNWTLIEVVGDRCIQVAFEKSLQVAHAAARPDSRDVSAFVHLRVNASGEAEYEITNGPSPRTAVIPWQGKQ